MSIVHHDTVAHAVLLAFASLACLPLAARATSDPPVANPLGAGQGVTLEPAPASAAPHQHRAVFVCHGDGGPVFADRPCAAGATVRSLAIETPGAGAAVSSSAAKCVRLQRQVDELNDRMRAGYSAREAARLWQRWRDAKERLRQARC